GLSPRCVPGLAAPGCGALALALGVLVERAVGGPPGAGPAGEAPTVAALLVFPADRLAEAVRTIGEEEDLGPGKFVRVVGPNHHVLAQFRTVPPSVAAHHPQQLDGLRLVTVGKGQHLHRVAWAPGPTGGWVVLGVRAINQSLLCRRANAAIGIAALGLVALLTTLAWAVSSRATADLNRLAVELETIEAGSLDHRLAARPTAEVNRVVDVL